MPSTARRRARRLDPAFTLVELLVVMIVLGILAGIAIPVFLRVRENGQRARATSELNQLAKFSRITQLRQPNFKPDNWVACDTPAGRSLRNLPASDSCWVVYNSLLDQIEAGTGESMAGYRAGDPWRTPYVFDQNEGEVYGTDCLRQDTIRSVGSNGVLESSSRSDDVVFVLTRNRTTPDC